MRTKAIMTARRERERERERERDRSLNNLFDITI